MRNGINPRVDKLIKDLEQLNSPVGREAIEEIIALRRALQPFALKLKVVQRQQTRWAGIAVQAEDVVTANDVYYKNGLAKPGG